MSGISHELKNYRKNNSIIIIMIITLKKTCRIPNSTLLPEKKLCRMNLWKENEKEGD